MAGQYDWVVYVAVFVPILVVISFLLFWVWYSKRLKKRQRRCAKQRLASQQSANYMGPPVFVDQHPAPAYGPPPSQYGGPPPSQYGGPPQHQYGGPPQHQYGGPPQHQYGGPPQHVAVAVGSPLPPPQLHSPPNNVSPHGGHVGAPMLVAGAMHGPVYAVPPPMSPQYQGGITQIPAHIPAYYAQPQC